MMVNAAIRARRVVIAYFLREIRAVGCRSKKRRPPPFGRSLERNPIWLKHLRSFGGGGRGSKAVPTPTLPHKGDGVPAAQHSVKLANGGGPCGRPAGHSLRQRAGGHKARPYAMCFPFNFDEAHDGKLSSRKSPLGSAT